MKRVALFVGIAWSMVSAEAGWSQVPPASPTRAPVAAETLPRTPPQATAQAKKRVEAALVELQQALLDLQSQQTGVNLRQFIPPRDSSPGPYWPFPQGPWDPIDGTSLPAGVEWRQAKTPSPGGQAMERIVVDRLSAVGTSIRDTTELARVVRGGSGKPQPASIIAGLLLGAAVVYVGCVIHVDLHEGGLEGPAGFDRLGNCLHDRLGFF
jgi:hypothetical protein